MKAQALGHKVRLFAIVSAIVTLVIAAGCARGVVSSCCPAITAFTLSDPWVCPSQCPGGGRVRVTYRVEFTEDNELCEPGDARFVIRNVTDGIDLPPLTVKNPKKGVYEGSEDLTISKDTVYNLKVTMAHKGCLDVSTEFKVDVVDDGDYHDICFTGKLDWPMEHKGYVPFGPGVLIDHTSNPQNLMIRITKDSVSEFVRPYSDGVAHADNAASGNWALGLSSAADCGIYNNSATNPQLCTRVSLKCVCP